MEKRKLITCHIIITVIAILLAVLLLSYFAVTIKNCSLYFKNQALSHSLDLTTEKSSFITDNINTSAESIKSISSKVSKVTGYDQLDILGEDLVKEFDIACLQFYFEGNIELQFGEGSGSSSYEDIKTLLNSNGYSVSKVFNDDSLGIDCFAAYAPIKDNSEIDGVIAYFTIEKAFNYDFSQDEMLKMSCLAETDGSIIDFYNAKGFKSDVSHNIFSYLKNINQTKSPIAKLEEKCQKGLPSSYEFSVDSKSYVISATTVANLSRNYIFLNIYSKNDLINSEYPLYDQLFGACTAIAIFTIIIIMLCIINNYSNISKISKLDDIDPLVGCSSYNKFSQRALEILSANRHSGYALIYFDINKFSYVRDNYGSELCENILRQVSTIIKKILSDNETYGHIVDDRFVILMHCANMQEFSTRLKIISALIANYQETKQNNFTLSLAIGVYKIERNHTYSIQEMLDRASIAKKLHKRNNSTEPFIMYDPSIRAAYVREAEIESKMEYALKNDEFKVFYQPKYSIQNDCIDAAEALVRWYDKTSNTYINPINFIPLFEVNGFIAKLDLYVFKTVCKFLHELTERGEKTVPISINVSRVSATQFDFLSNYINIKKTYGIPDDYLMLEFTESFAYENYHTLANIILELRKNGFKCSIDDFGSGYSSFEILKELSMDELKLDKMFLNPSSDQKKDIILLKSIIQLGNSFNMKVTQEGVETVEQLKLLEQFGCNVIQGYYYSKPMPASDFIEFINGSTSLNSVIHNILEKNDSRNILSI